MEEFGTPLSAQRLRARVSGEGDERCVVLEDGDSEVVLDDSIGSSAAAAVGYERVAAVLLARAAELRRPPVPLDARPGALGVPPGWT